MIWFAAHLIMYFKRRKGRQKHFLVWENIVLVEASSSDEAWDKAEQLGREDESYDDESLTIGGYPSRMVFAGVRKVTLCVDENSRPVDGTEVTYNEIAMESEVAIRKLAAGKRVKVELIDPFPEDDEPMCPPTNGKRQRKKQKQVATVKK
jgi:hypothetical protein